LAGWGGALRRPAAYVPDDIDRKHAANFRNSKNENEKRKISQLNAAQLILIKQFYGGQFISRTWPTSSQRINKLKIPLPFRKRAALPQKFRIISLVLPEDFYFDQEMIKQGAASAA